MCTGAAEDSPPSNPLPFERQPRTVPVVQASRIAAHVGVTVVRQAVVDGQAGQAFGVRAVDDDVVILLEAGF
jgi:hypothetical protein